MSEMTLQRDVLLATLEKSDLVLKCKWCGQKVKVLVRRLKKNIQGYCPNCKKGIRSLSKAQKRILRFGDNPGGVGQELPAYLRKLPYAKYLESKHWRSFRRKAIDKALKRCQVCNAEGSLDVHHRTYERKGCEELRDVIVLCRPCHTLFHTNGRLA